MALDLIRARCPALEATVEEDDGEVELSLGLSLGGSSRKAARAGAPPRGQVVEARAGEADEDLGGSASSPSSFPRPPPFPLVDGEDALERTRRREIHAFRRREARRKRDDKKQQQKRGICRPAPAAAARGFPGVVPPLERAFSSGDRLAMEAREYQIRAKDREARVEEALDCVSNHKLSSNHNPNPTDDANSYPSFNPICSDPNLVPFAAQSFPVVGAPYSYPHLQYVPITNGFGIPCVMPCWAPAMSPAADGLRAEGNVFHPVACRAFQQCSLPVVEPAGGRSPPGSNSNTVDTNDRKGAGVESAPSWTASQGSSSSPATSGHRGGSLMRGGSNISSSTSDGRSRPSHTHTKHHPRPSPKQATGLSPGQSDTTTSLPQIATDLTIVGQPPSERSPTTTSPRQNPPVNKPDPAAGHSSPPRQAPPHQLPHMPCVSATGNGPNGRTITGVLYRYTKSEVCIVCACHGSSFSPAEFVEHAGGTDVTHPLRQITVVSS